uniref:Cytochrome P450 n=1 Tax=Chromera velia CCMP2878 TaxID=1169474 RepID=A0A0G4H028_9ALVE|mmetsp:Transcript_20510/g.41001  ORF Transcript_20510/g.41001 Transcript_20510/m.41001 type:complete len:487 (+) Transcript_20510:96-1556(+)|eukprot:Cvel_24139.t1-p1 / transcript=Cvel_24139.t1 / gene=Cvel_24139 / organism=Chromera_velia_CCMP2878 / gene_product=hypothetical protein / transcript_product=hypothetical protein / location=Cvel_scaffold2575:9636-11093(-) / protein_length=486 / sequence_SO=supercontig / SO=protein_coding / is_pseudo=false
MRAVFLSLSAFLSLSVCKCFIAPSLQKPQGKRTRPVPSRQINRLSSVSSELTALSAEKDETPLPPGDVSFLSSLKFLFQFLLIPFWKLLARKRSKYGPLLMLRAGPTRQVWIGNWDLLEKVYGLKECAARSELEGRPFGDFLFRVENPEEAARIREKQFGWLQKNLVGGKNHQKMIEEGMKPLYSRIPTETATEWPHEDVSDNIYRILIGCLWGNLYSLTEVELKELRQLLNEFLAIRFKMDRKKKQRDEVSAGIRRVIQKGLTNAGHTSEETEQILLPLTVATSVGGADVLPTLFQWIMLVCACVPERQERLRNLSKPEDIVSEIYKIIRRCPYSVALGPPRRCLEDVEIDLDSLNIPEGERKASGTVKIPKGAMLFAMHPTVVDGAGCKYGEVAEDDYGRVAFGSGLRSCVGKSVVDTLLPLMVKEFLQHYSVSLSVGRDWEKANEWRRWFDERDPGKVKTKQRGMLLAPYKTPELVFSSRGRP